MSQVGIWGKCMLAEGRASAKGLQGSMLHVCVCACVGEEARATGAVSHGEEWERVSQRGSGRACSCGVFKGLCEGLGFHWE